LVVDDNSTDKTIKIVNDLKQTCKNLDVLIRAFDHGLSHSVADGFSKADSDIFIAMDADFSHPPIVIPNMFNGIVTGNNVVIGSRYIKGAGSGNGP
jgi:dolichol-phosphate mannosyltransferase